MNYLSEKKLQRQAQQRKKKDVETNDPQKDSDLLFMIYYAHPL